VAPQGPMTFHQGILLEINAGYIKVIQPLFRGESRNIEGRGHIVCRAVWIHLWAAAICTAEGSAKRRAVQRGA